MSLENEIKKHLAANEKISVSEYMELCLTHEKFGYYTNAKNFVGDFVTAPEVSQMFGELVGMWIVSMCEIFQFPKKFCIIELGGGNGTLMSDIWRITKSMPEFQSRIEIHMVEISPTLTARQKKTLKNINADVFWYENCNDLPDHMPCFFIANEMLDALPTEQLIFQNNKWHKRAICLENDTLKFCTSPIDKLPNMPAMPDSNTDGLIFEYSPKRQALIEQISRHLMTTTGAALFVDYGHLKSDFGDTLQAIKKHKKVDPLTDSGQCDLTSHVDFEALEKIAKENGCVTAPTINQTQFLIFLGLRQRAEKLMESKNKNKKEMLKIIRSFARLADPDQMGELFKAFCFGNFGKHEIKWPQFDDSIGI